MSVAVGRTIRKGCALCMSWVGGYYCLLCVELVSSVCSVFAGRKLFVMSMLLSSHLFGRSFWEDLDIGRRKEVPVGCIPWCSTDVVVMSLDWSVFLGRP